MNWYVHSAKKRAWCLAPCAHSQWYCHPFSMTVTISVSASEVPDTKLTALGARIAFSCKDSVLTLLFMVKILRLRVMPLVQAGAGM